MTVPVIGWGRKCLQFSLQVPVASGRFQRWCSKLFIQSVGGCLSISKSICRALPEQRSGLSWCIDYRLLCWGCQNSLCFLMHLKGKDRVLILLEILLRRHHKMVSFGTLWYTQCMCTPHLPARTEHPEIVPEWTFGMEVEMYNVLASRTPQSKGICHQMLGDTSP